MPYNYYKGNKIWCAAHEINYIPNQHARILKSGVTQKSAYQVAVVLARISNLDDDPFFREVFRDRIQHKHKEFMRIEFPCRIIQRESCYYKKCV